MRPFLENIEVYSLGDRLVLVCEDEVRLSRAVNILETEGAQVLRRPTRRANLCIAAIRRHCRAQ